MVRSSKPAPTTAQPGIRAQNARMRWSAGIEAAVPGTPAAEVAALQQRVYSRAGEDEPLVAGVDPLTGATVLATQAEHRLRALTTPGRSVDAGHTAPLGTPPPVGALPPSGSSLSRARELLRGPGRGVLGLLLGLMLGILGTLGVLGTRGVLGVSGDGSTTEATVSDAAAAAALRIFDAPQVWPGGQPPDLGLEYEPESIRSVLGPPPGSGYGVYVARRGSAEYCIIVRDADGTGHSSCATIGTIARSGLHIRALVWSPRGEGREPVLVQVFANWLASGEILAGSSPRAEDLTPPDSAPPPGASPTTPSTPSPAPQRG